MIGLMLMAGILNGASGVCWRRGLRVAGVGWLALVAGVRAETPVAFNRDIRPILSDNCFACHGPDPGTRKAGLRLDTKEGFFEATPKRGPVVVAGKPEESPLWKRLVTTDLDDVMPPPQVAQGAHGSPEDPGPAVDSRGSSVAVALVVHQAGAN